MKFFLNRINLNLEDKTTGTESIELSGKRIYILIGIFTIKPELSYGDEGRYAIDVKRILTGQPLTLAQAPGHPLFLAIPRAIGLSWYWLKWLNPFLLFGVIVFVAKSLTLLKFPKKYVLLIAYSLGFYIPFWNELRYLLTEPLALMTISCSMYFCINFSQTNQKKYFILAATSLAYLALIKALVGYVVIAMAICALTASFFAKNADKRTFRKLAVIFGLAFLLCTPYLAYTFSQTGKIFYWANTGGENIYWLTNPTKGEYGFWNPEQKILKDDNFKHHREFIKTIPSDDRLKRDEIFSAAAIENIKKHPGKCAYNWLCNIGRMFFNYPYDYKYQNSATLLYTIPNSLIFWLAISALPIMYYCRKEKFTAVITTLLMFVFVYWLAQSLSTAGPRKMYLVIPIFCVTYAYIIKKLLTKLQLKVESA